MVIKSITDENYVEFRNSPRSALVLSTSWCQECERYNPVVNALSKKLPFVNFGKTVLDKDRSSSLKREYSGINGWTFPTTLLFKDQKEVSRINGFALYPNAFSRMQQNLVLESTVFVPSSNGLYVPAIVQHINDSNGSYLLKLGGNSSLGRKGQTVQLTADQFSWDLESRL